MLKNLKYSVVIISVLISLIFLPSCKDFLNPPQELNVTQNKLFDDYYEYRSVEMGLYGLQQQLVEQLVVLGELRGDLMTVTPNADADLIEINNFQVSKTNKYANPANFYKLIAACNSFISVLKKNHPEILDKKVAVTNYDKLYGEALCMRAWAFFNVVRIYGKVPVIYESLTSPEEIEGYLNSPVTYVDSLHIVFGKDGFKNDTTKNVPITLTKKFYDTEMVIRVFTKELEDEIKVVDGVRAVGVNHYIDNGDKTWEVTIWNTYACHALLGQMYLTLGDFTKAASELNAIVWVNDATSPFRYQLGGGNNGFSFGNWRNIFTNVDIREHILTLQFSKTNQQQNGFQRLFYPFEPHKYMLKPTKASVHMWETQWYGTVLNVNQANPSLTTTRFPGMPGDFYRGFGTSYIYVSPAGLVPPIQSMLYFKMQKDVRSYTSMMADMDTVIYKYNQNKNVYDQDANFIIYRAGGIQLYLAEIYTWWEYLRGGSVSPFLTNAQNILNDGSQYNPQVNRTQLGVRGRAFLPPVNVGNINYKMDPFTNEVIGYTDLTGNIAAKQKMLEEIIMDERARELAFEGERFYDLMRIAKRRKVADPKDDYLAKKVSAKYTGGQRQAIYNLLLDEKNWYINMFN